MPLDETHFGTPRKSDAHGTCSANNINELVESEGDVNLHDSLLKIRQHERAYIEEPSEELADMVVAEKDVFVSMLEASAMDEDTQLFINGDLEVYVKALLSYGDSLVKLRAGDPRQLPPIPERCRSLR